MMPSVLTKVVKLFNNQPDINKTGFLSAFFKVSPESFTDADKFSLDILSEGEKVAPVITDLSTGAVILSPDKFTNREMPFPVYAVKKPAFINDLMRRRPGESAYATEQVNWHARLAGVLVSNMGQMTKMIRRSMELQAAKVMQEGVITLTDENGVPAFELKPGAPAEHFPTAAIPWRDRAKADPVADISALADTIRDNGLVDITTVIMGEKAWEGFILNEGVQKLFKRDVLYLAELNPALAGKGAKKQGYLDWGPNLFQFYTYNARYEPFEGGAGKAPYLDPNKVILLPNIEDLDFRRLFGGVPTVEPDTRFAELFGTGKVQIGNEYDIRPRVYRDVNNEAYYAEIKSRPLMMPVSFNRFGCLTVE